MRNRAQLGLEYLMTYGWALIFVATIITLLVFVVGRPAPGVVFNVSDPTKFLLKSAGVSGNTAGIVLQNATGGKITIKSITLSGDVGVVYATKFNGGAWPTFPVDIIAGGEIRLEGLNASNGAANSRVTILYKDYADFDREVRATSGQGGPAGIVAGYSFEEVVAGKTADGSGKNQDGTIYGATMCPASCPGITCPSGNCMQFEDEDYIQLPTTLDDISNYGGETGASTIAAWVQVLTANKPNFITQNIAGSSYFSANSDSKLESTCGNCDDTSDYSPISSGAINVEKWTHVAYVLEGGTGYKFYINGKPEDHLGPNPCLKSYGGNSSISTPSTGFGFEGLIDEVRIYNRALGSAEICSECKRFAANVAAIQPGFTCSC